eukprot:2799066-Prymnesium_polylepis.1
MLCTCSPRGSPLSQEAGGRIDCAPQRGNIVVQEVQHPTFFTFTPLQAPCQPVRTFRTFRGAQTEPGTGDVLQDRLYWNLKN